MIAQQSTPDISSKALLVSVEISEWRARKLDRKVTDEVNRLNNASEDAGRYNKLLLPGQQESHKRLVRAVSNARKVQYTHTLAWDQRGWQLLPCAEFMEFSAAIRRCQVEFHSALSEFLADYAESKGRAKAALNGLYREEDYPDVDELRAKYRFDVTYAPLPIGGDIRWELSEEALSEIEASVRDRVTQATQTAVASAWERLEKVVKNVKKICSDPKARIHPSLIGNVADLVDVLRRLNVTDDAALEAYRSRVEQELATIDPQDLRDSDETRAEVADAADKILADMQAAFGSR